MINANRWVMGALTCSGFAHQGGASQSILQCNNLYDVLCAWFQTYDQTTNTYEK